MAEKQTREMTDTSKGTQRSAALFEEAKTYIPGGVNSPCRAYLAVQDTPRFIRRAEGAYIWDVDANRYIDYIGSWGPMILGNNHPVILEAVRQAAEDGLSFGAATEREVQMAKLLCELVPSMDMVRMVNSGTEATMSALRAARGYTGREKIIKFEGCYHGHSDALLVKAGSGLIAGGGAPDSAGVTAGCAKDTLTARFNDIASVEQLFADNPRQIAAVILEPVAANMGVVLPNEGFLEALRRLCTAEGAVLIFDEVITGFRLALGGAQQLFGVEPDMTTFGKIIGGGMPVGAYGGKRAIMETVAPVGSVYQAGTLSGNPVAMAAGLAQLTYLKEHPEVYNHINAMGTLLFDGIREILSAAGGKGEGNSTGKLGSGLHGGCTVNSIGSIGSLFFTPQPVMDFASAKASDLTRFAAYFRAMLRKGIYLAPAQFEAVFVSAAHTKAEIEATLRACAECFGV